MEELVSLLSNVGFPVALSVYLLVRVEKKLEDLAERIEQFIDNHR